MKYILIEAENCQPVYIHHDTFDTLEEAKATLKNRYHEEAVERAELMECADIAEDGISASYTSKEGVSVAFKIVSV